MLSLSVTPHDQYLPCMYAARNVEKLYIGKLIWKADTRMMFIGLQILPPKRLYLR